jgi:hypothetical protein
MPDFTSYYVLIVIAIVVYQFAAAFFTAWLADQKGYNFTPWFFWGLVFGGIPLLAVGFAPMSNGDDENTAISPHSALINDGQEGPDLTEIIKNNTVSDEKLKQYEQTPILTDEKTDFIPKSLGKFAAKIVLYRSPTRSSDIIAVKDIARTIELNKVQGEWLNLKVNKQILGWAHIPEY